MKSTSGDAKKYLSPSERIAEYLKELMGDSDDAVFNLALALVAITFAILATVGEGDKFCLYTPSGCR